MMYAAAGQFFCYVFITICIRYNEMDSLAITTQQAWAKGSIAFFFLYYVFFGIGWQGVPWASVQPWFCRCTADLQSCTQRKLTRWQCGQRALLSELPQTGYSISWVSPTTHFELLLLTILTSRRNHAPWYRISPLEILHNMDRFQLLIHSNW